ncbi:hypothetical protein BGX34_008324 [Mortierella sp. NVP85]|nr:hypothetical protein BGX34_008324 [Mortierella sp. NVP85]
MVKITFSIAAMAAMVASVVIAAPFDKEPMKVFSSKSPENRCIPETTIKEYHPFYLESLKLRNLVSKAVDKNLVVGGVKDDKNKNFAQLELCIASTDYGCDKYIPSKCIYENVEYRFRVNKPEPGYFKITEEGIEIVENFADASGLNLYKEEGWGLRIAHVQPDGKRLVFATNGSGKPLSLEEPEKNEARQWFEIIEPDFKAEELERCVPGTTLKEYHPFYLESVDLESLVSKKTDSQVLVGGIRGNKNFERLELCIVSSTYECDPYIPSKCILHGKEYRFRVNGPLRGYLKIGEDDIEIVDSFDDASGLSLHREGRGHGFRVAHTKEDGSHVVFTTHGGGRRITAEEPFKNDPRQWFKILEIPRPRSIDLIVSGGPEDLNLVVCLVLDNGSCYPYSEGPPKCIRQNARYLIRVHLPTEAYLKVQSSFVKITDRIEEASYFNLYVDEDGVLRIGDGTGRVISAKDYLRPVTLEGPEKSISQSFQLQPYDSMK